MKKKVLFINSSLTSGGSEKVMTIIANEFCNNGYDVSMILLYGTDKENYYLNSKINLIRFKYNKKNRLLRLIEKFSKIRKTVKQNKYDCVISFMHAINADVLISLIGINIPIIVSERCDPSSRNIGKLRQLLENRLYSKAKNIVLQTEDVKVQYPKYLYRKMVVIPNPISNDLIEPFKGIRENKIVAAGRLTNQKNFEMLINAFNDLKDRYKEYRLYIYGDGPLRNKLEKMIEEYKLQDRVYLPGYVENVSELMNSAKIYISTSNYEGISNSMLEALALGVPSICTDCPVGGAKLMIKDRENGILIPVNDIDALKKSIVELLDNNTFAEKISQNSIKIRESYSSYKIYKKWEELIKK